MAVNKKEEGTVIPAGITEITSEVLKEYKDRRGKIVLPNGCKKICNCAFTGTKFRGMIELPESVEEIEAGAFYECGLDAVKILNPRCVISAEKGDYLGTAIPRWLAIYGKPDSTAQMYAILYRRAFIEI